jgi:hypothetical protein
MTSTTVATLNDRMAALEQRTAQQRHSEVWTPEVGDVLVGLIIGSEVVIHPMYGNQFQLHVRNRDGVIVRIWLSRFLQDGLRAQNAQPDDLIAIAFHGKKRNSQGREYNSYQLTVEKA